MHGRNIPSEILLVISLCSVWYAVLECVKKLKLSCHMLQKKTFCHFLKEALNQKISFTKVVQFGMISKNVGKNVKPKLSFGQSFHF